MSFLYPLLFFIQPSFLFPEIAEYRPMIWFSAFSLLIGLASRPDYSRKEAFAHPIFVWLMVFMLVQVLSVYYGGGAAMLEEFQFWMVYPVFTITSILLMSNATGLRLYVWGMMLGGMFIVVYGMYALYAGIGEAALGRASAYGTYGNSNDYTYIIIQILPFLYLYRRAGTGFLTRGFLGLAMIACVAGVLLSLSRGGILALVLECALIVLLGMEGKRRLLLLPVLAVLGAGLISYQYAMRAQSDGEEYTVEHSIGGRQELWRSGLNMFKDRPLLGVGSRRFVENSADYYELSHTNRGKVSHNTYIEILSGSGFLGLIAFIAMIYCLVREVRRRPVHPGPPWLEATRLATLISILSILFRATSNARQVDWSFWTLCSIGVVYVLVQRGIASTAGKAGEISAPPGADSGGTRTTPGVSGRG